MCGVRETSEEFDASCVEFLNHEPRACRESRSKMRRPKCCTSTSIEPYVDINVEMTVCTDLNEGHSEALARPCEPVRVKEVSELREVGRLACLRTEAALPLA